MRRLFSPQACAADHARVLLTFRNMHRSLDDEIARAVVDATGMPLPPSRADALLRDLTALGVAPGAFAPPPPLPRLDAKVGCLGAAYVLAGSVLGAPVVASRLREFRGPAAPVAYFTEQRAELLQYWREFLGRLEGAVSPAARPELVAAAEAIFLWLRAALLAAERAPLNAPLELSPVLDASGATHEGCRAGAKAP